MDDDLKMAERMRALDTGDNETDHYNGDALLCEILLRLGYTETVKAYEAIGKWYA